MRLSNLVELLPLSASLVVYNPDKGNMEQSPVKSWALSFKRWKNNDSFPIDHYMFYMVERVEKETVKTATGKNKTIFHVVCYMETDIEYERTCHFNDILNKW